MAGDRDPHQLAAHRDYRCRASEAEIVAALTGHYRDEHVFVNRARVQVHDCPVLKRSPEADELEGRREIVVLDGHHFGLPFDLTIALSRSAFTPSPKCAVGCQIRLPSVLPSRQSRTTTRCLDNVLHGLDYRVGRKQMNLMTGTDHHSMPRVRGFRC